METKIWIIFIALLVILAMMMYKIIKNKEKNKITIVLFAIMLVYFIYSFFTVNGSTRLSITLYGHPIIAYTTKFDDNYSINDNAKNKKYLLPTKKMDDLSSFFECKSYGIIKITTYYGF